MQPNLPRISAEAARHTAIIHLFPLNSQSMVGHFWGFLFFKNMGWEGLFILLSLCD